MLCTALALFAAASSTLAQPANPPGIIVAPPEQTVPERQGVLDRARPDYDQLGIRLGSFLVFPTGQLAESYDTNVFATTTNTKSDFYTTLNPSIALRSDWNVHALDLEASSQTKRYASLVSENVTNFAVSGGGRLARKRRQSRPFDEFRWTLCGFQLGRDQPCRKCPAGTASLSARYLRGSG